MIRRPDTSDTLVDTRDWLLGVLQLLSTCQLKQIGLLKYLLGLKVPDTNRLLPSIDIVSLDDGMSIRPWGYADFDLRVRLCEGGEVVF